MKTLILPIILAAGIVSHPLEADYKLEQASCELYFSPDGHVAEQLIALIDKEQKSIQAAIYCLTHREIAKALVQAKKRGVAVEIIVDPFSVKIRSPLKKLADAGISVLVWDPPAIQTGSKKEKRPLMHDKFCILGGTSVWTGSFNFTYDANLSNQENAILLHDTSIAKKFQEQFLTIKRQACRPYYDYLAHHPKSKKKGT